MQNGMELFSTATKLLLYDVLGYEYKKHKQ